MNKRAVLFVACLSLSGCVTMDARQASERTTMDLCRIAVVGTTNFGFTSYDLEGRLAAEQEANRRGTDCAQYADAIRADHARFGQALGAMSQAVPPDSGWTTTPSGYTAPAQPSGMRTTCGRPIGNTTTCTTFYNDGSPPTTTRCSNIAGSITCQ